VLEVKQERKSARGIRRISSNAFETGSRTALARNFAVVLSEEAQDAALSSSPSLFKSMAGRRAGLRRS
jgi:hypothetical protein